MTVHLKDNRITLALNPTTSMLLSQSSRTVEGLTQQDCHTGSCELHHCVNMYKRVNIAIELTSTVHTVKHRMLHYKFTAGIVWRDTQCLAYVMIAKWMYMDCRVLSVEKGNGRPEPPPALLALPTDYNQQQRQIDSQACRSHHLPEQRRKKSLCLRGLKQRLKSQTCQAPRLQLRRPLLAFLRRL